jgi:mono/diheme cytochrome c family protein
VRSSFVAKTAVLLFTLATPATAALAAPPAAPPDATFDIWVRVPGQHAGGNVVLRERLQSVDLDTLALKEVERFDVQYGSTRRYRGASLVQLIEQYGPPAGTDLALIHCANGMIVPVPFRDPAALARMDVLVANRVWTPDSGGRWTRRFPAVPRQSTMFRDRRPITFFGAKLVASSAWHPYLKPGTEGTFSPWMHTDTPVGIELVRSAAYDRQLEPATTASSSPAAMAGRQVFRTTCQFCHGARDVGAKFGWDVVDPIPLASWRRPSSLYFHVTLRRADAPALGMMMPALKHLSGDDVKAVWEYLRLLAGGPQPPYAP